MLLVLLIPQYTVVYKCLHYLFMIINYQQELFYD